MQVIKRRKKQFMQAEKGEKRQKKRREEIMKLKQGKKKIEDWCMRVIENEEILNEGEVKKTGEQSM